MSKVRVQGIQVAYDELGSGPAVVLLHGYPFDRSMWLEQAEVLKGSHRVIIPDLRGHGETEVTAEASIEQMAHDVASLLDILEISRVSLGGLSMGGYVSLAFYRSFPLRVRSLILADTRAQADTEEIRKSRAVQAEKALQEGMEGIADSLLQKLLAPETVARRPEIVKRIREMMVQTKPEGAAAALAAMAQRPDQTELLSRIIAPTMIVVGREDSITPVADSEMMHREIGSSRFEIVEGAGHVSNLEKPKEFNEVLLRFLHDLEG